MDSEEMVPFDSQQVSSKPFEYFLEKIGSAGRYQWFLCIVMLYMATFSTEATWVNFVEYRDPHFCKIDELQNFSKDVQKRIAIPRSEDGIFSSCKMFKQNYSQYSEGDYHNWNETVGASNDTTGCSQWVYDDSTIFKETVISDFDWVCQYKYMVELMSTVMFMGVFIGGIIGAIYADKFGRKPALITFYLIKVIGIILCVLSHQGYLFLTGHFLVGLSFFIYNVGFLKTTEVIDKKYRNLITMMSGSFYCVGQMFCAILAYLCNKWRHFYWVNIAIIVVPLPIIFAFQESPKWLLSVNKLDEYEKAMTSIAKFNGKLDEIESKNGKLNIRNVNMSSPNQIRNLCSKVFRSRILIKWSLCLFSAWFLAGLGYYSLILNISILHGSVFWNFVLLAAVELPSNLLFMVLLNSPRFGRRGSIMLNMFVSAILCLTSVLVKHFTAESFLHTVPYLLLKGTLTSFFNALFLYTSELYPTNIRATGLIACSSAARIGASIAPFFGEALVSIWIYLPNVIIGTLCLIVLSIFSAMPETLNKDMPQTIEDIERKDEDTSRKR